MDREMQTLVVLNRIAEATERIATALEHQSNKTENKVQKKHEEYAKEYNALCAIFGIK